MTEPLTYQWLARDQHGNTLWQRGRKAEVDGATYSEQAWLGCRWLMRTLPLGALTFVNADDLQVAPAPGPTKEEV